MKFITTWFILFLVCVTTRLPYLLGPHLYFDGDEAVLGIMAQDVLAGNGLPVYYYGQQYGFSLFEVLSTAFLMLFLGNGVWALKLGGLLVFSLGLTFVHRLLLERGSKPATAWVLVLCLSLFPIWFLWAAKVRGGYVTAFAAVCGAAYFLGRKQAGGKEAIFSALCVALAFVSQPLLLLPFGFCLVYAVWNIFKPKQRMVWILTLCMSYALLQIPVYADATAWVITPKMQYDWATFKDITTALPSIFMGYFYYGVPFELPAGIRVVFVAHILLFFGLLAMRLKKGSTPEKTLLVLALIGIAVSCLAIPYVDGKGYRYFIGPFTALAGMYVYMLHESYASAKQGMIKGLAVLFLFVAPTWAYRHISAFWQVPETNDMQAFRELDQQLQQLGITGIFCSDPFLVWQLNYYNPKQYSARYLFNHDRKQIFVDKANRCYRSANCRTAIVGIYGSPLGMDLLPGWHDSLINVADRFYIQPRANEVFLKKAGFELPQYD